MKKEINIISEIAILVGLALVFDVLAGLFSPFKYGGSISFAMLPIFIIAFRRGLKPGLFAGFIFGVLQALLAEALGYGVFAFIVEEGWWKFILMFVLDYILPFTLLGVAAIFKNPLKNKTSFILGISLASFLRYLSHGISGVLIWDYYAELAGMNPWFYSFIAYNLPYMLSSYLLCIFLGLIIYKRGIWDYNLS
ncbi:MAG: energy-coupled thiamine transporter ThiT [Candidatus Izemoplasmatales bacterium]